MRDRREVVERGGIAVTAGPELLTIGRLTESNDALGDPVELRRRADDDGYLFFRDLLPVEDVNRVRHDVLRRVAADGWLDLRRPLDDGFVDHDAVGAIPIEELRDDIGVSGLGYVHIQQLESMHRLPHHPRLLALYRDLLGDDPFVHPRHIVRAMTSHPDLHPTPPHQDFPLVQGSGATWTCWFPLGDCPRSMGSLAVLPRSHRHGRLAVEQAPGAGHIGAQICDDHTDAWRSADFAAGDVLTFPAFTVHRSLRPVDRARLRLSMDVRYQSGTEPIEARSLTNHADVDWSIIYEGWTDASLQYYWQSDELPIVPWDDSFIQPSRRIC